MDIKSNLGVNTSSAPGNISSKEKVSPDFPQFLIRTMKQDLDLAIETRKPTPIISSPIPKPIPPLTTPSIPLKPPAPTPAPPAPVPVPTPAPAKLISPITIPQWVSRLQEQTEIAVKPAPLPKPPEPILPRPLTPPPSFAPLKPLMPTAAPEISAKEKEVKKKEKAEKEKLIKQQKKEHRNVLKKDYQSAKTLVSQGEFKIAINILQKIADDKKIGWWLKWRINRLLKKAKKISIVPVFKEEKKIIPSVVSPVISPPPPKPPEFILPRPLTPPPLPSKPFKSLEEMIKEPEILPPSPLPPSGQAPGQVPSPAKTGLGISPSIQAKPAIPPIKPLPSAPPTLPIEPAPTPILKVAGVIAAVPTAKPLIPAKPLVPAGIDLTKIKPKSIFKNRLAWSLGVFFIVILLGLGGWFYLKNQAGPIAGTPTPIPSPTITESPSATPTSTPQAPPAALFTMEEQKIIELKKSQEGKNLNEILQTSQISNGSPASFTQILFKSSEQPNKFLSLKDLVALFFPDLYLENYLENNQFSVYVWWEPASNSSPFLDIQTQPRLGLIAAISQETAGTSAKKTELKEIISKNESFLPLLFKKLLPDIDLTNLEVSFKDNNYQNIAIRYFNFLPDASLSIDYAFVNDLFLISFSKQSMYAALDRILAK